MQAYGRRPRTVLAPIPEAPECLDQPGWDSARVPSVHSAADSDLSDAPTHRDRAERGTDERELHAFPDRADRTNCDAKCAAVKRERLALRSAEEWPAHWSASGRVTLRASANPQAKGTRAVCRVRAGVLTLGIERRVATGETTEEIAAEVPVEELAVCLQGGRTDMFMLATVHKNKIFDEIYCFCDDPARCDRWIAVFDRGLSADGFRHLAD